MTKKELTEKEKAFCRELLIDNNATQAAIRAGYSEKTADVTGTKLQTIPMVAEEIQRLRVELIKRTNISQEWVLLRFKEISDRCMQAEPQMELDPKTGQWVQTGIFEFDPMGAIKATENIARHLGFYAKDKEKPEEKKKSKRINVTINVPPFPPAEPNGGQ